MDIESLKAQVTSVVAGQLAIASDDPTVAVAGEAMLAALGPALAQMGASLAEQAAAEVGAQLPDHQIDVVLRARITVRLPEDLKEDLELAASDRGDSVNTFVVKALAGKTKARRKSSRSTFEGTIET